MKNVLYITTLSLLVITGVAATYGGLGLIIDPTGEGIGLSLSRLRFLPFKNYLVPGLFVFTVTGIGSLAIAVMLFRRKRRAPIFLMVQGILLVCWIIVQSLSVPSSFLQYVFGTSGVVFIISGFILSRGAVQFRN
jgi:hypothetical protein